MLNTAQQRRFLIFSLIYAEQPLAIINQVLTTNHLNKLPPSSYSMIINHEVKLFQTSPDWILSLAIKPLSVGDITKLLKSDMAADCP